MSKRKQNLSAAPAPLVVADRLHSTAIHLLRRLRVVDRASGIGPAQLSALSVLVFGGPRSLGELAAAEQVRPPTMSRVVAGLVRAKLARRHTGEDRRSILIEPTASGTRILTEARKRRVATLAAALRSLSPRELKKLNDFAETIQQVLQKLV
jgi:DNA-binding MarR family transcriptional regulator